jgi:hypothetical protein
MTKDEMNLHALVGKTADGDFLREMIGFAAAADGARGRRPDRRGLWREECGPARPAQRVVADFAMSATKSLAPTCCESRRSCARSRKKAPAEWTGQGTRRGYIIASRRRGAT